MPRASNYFCNFAIMNKSALKLVKEISIKNFKSVKSLMLYDCRRINVLIGRPNVGKSNILEALAMFDIPYMAYSANRSLRSLVRIENTADLFFNGNSLQAAVIVADDNKATITRTTGNGLSADIECSGESSKYAFGNTLTLTTKKPSKEISPILTYFFPKGFTAESSNSEFLLPPSGCNLMETVATIPDLKSRLAELFHGYGLKMMFDSGSQEIKAMRENGNDMFLVPFNSLADSLQRLIFYKAAVESNHGKTICFEEPEAHTFPPYITNVVNDIIASEENQFFLSTHSPYVVSSLLESVGDDLAIFVVDMNDGETTAKRLSDEELQAVYDNGVDMFYNIEAFLGK